MLGTPSYMAPEQAEGHSDAIDGRADQFALAVLAYVLLTGTDPFPGTTTGEVLTRIIYHDPEPMTGVPWRTDDIEAVLGKALSKRPENRYPRVLDFAHALSAATARLAAAHQELPAEHKRARGPGSRGSVSDLSTVVRLQPARAADLMTPTPTVEVLPTSIDTIDRSLTSVGAA